MNDLHFRFDQKVALVTGASAGIGKAIALAFAKAGAKVVVSDVNQELGLEVVSEIKEKHKGEATFIPCDVSQDSQVKTLIKETIQVYGQLHMACNNAGVEGVQATTTECSWENWEKVVSINMRGVWLCMKYQIPHMLQQGGGSIVNLSSIAGLVAFAGLPAYVASKHGVIGLSKTAAVEYATQNIRVNAICPGPIRTDMLQRIFKSNPEFEEAITAAVPQKKIGEVDDISQATVFLCSDAAKYITGQSLAIDGGQTIQ